MKTPAISVVFPIYGVEQYIERTLRSFVNQTFQDFEVILVDDGCLDRSIEIAEQFLRTTDLTWSIVHQNNQGQGPARDHGIEVATGKYVICVDSDDTVAPHFLESLYTAVVEHDCDVSMCGFQMVNEAAAETYCQDTAEFQCICKKEMLERFMYRTLVPILPAMLIRRDMIKVNQLTTCKGCRFSEDVYYMWLIFSAANIVAFAKQPLYNYLHRAGSTMTASSQERIITGFDAFSVLNADPRFENNFPGVEYLLPRWVLGALRSTAKIADYQQFYEIAQNMDYRSQMKKMKGFPEKKAIVLTLILRLHPRLFYFLIRLVG